MRDILMNGESILENRMMDPTFEGNPRLEGFWWLSDGKNFLPIRKISVKKEFKIPWIVCEKLFKSGIKRLTVGCGSIKKGGHIQFLKFV